MNKSNAGTALIVDPNEGNRQNLRSLLSKQGYQTIEAQDGQQAIDLFLLESPEIIFLNVRLPIIDGYQVCRQIKLAAKNSFAAVMFLTANSNDETLTRCIDAGGDDVLTQPFDELLLQSKIRSMQRIAALNREVRGMYGMIHREQEMAESVFVNAIQRSNINNPYIRQIVRPAGIFSGDMVLSAYSPLRELYFLTGDFTGHGLLAALGAMPVSEVFRAMTTKGYSPGKILIAINKKLKSMLPVGMFFGVQLVVVNNDLEQVQVFNAGMPDVLVIDGTTHQIKHRLVSTGLPLGVSSKLNPRELVQIAPLAYNDKIVMHSDGLIEARNEDDQEYGEDRLMKSIAVAPRNQIFDNLLIDLDQFCGENTSQADDVTLVEITCVRDVLPVDESFDLVRPSMLLEDRGEWKMSLEFNGARLHETNPVPILINYLMEMEELESERELLFTVLTELYMNALDHGVLNLDSSLKSDSAGFAEYFEQREERLASLDEGYVLFNLSVEQEADRRSILLRIEDSGEGFDFENFVAKPENDSALSGRGVMLIRELCDSLQYYGKGNIAIARFSWQTNASTDALGN